MSEGKVVQACIHWLLLHGCDIIRNNSGAIKTEQGHWVRFGKKGSGDVLALSPHGRWIEIECKFGVTEPSQEQLARQLAVNRLGGVYILVRNNVDALEENKDRILATPGWSHP